MSELRSERTRIRAIHLVTVAVLAGSYLFGATTVHASQMGVGNGPADFYSRNGSNCGGSAIDPVGVMFRGKRAGLTNVMRLLDLGAYTGWGHTENEDPQGLLVKEGKGEYECRQTDESAAEAPEGPNSRFHVRLWKIPATIGTSQLKTVGTPHHEDWRWSFEATGCTGVTYAGSHAVDQGGIENGDYSGFDRGRGEIKRAFARNGHKVEVEQWGNTALMEQCDGEDAGSHGWGVMIWINRAFDALAKEALETEATGSTLSGSLSTEEVTTEWWFSYGTKSSRGISGYPHKTAVKVISGSASVDVNAPVSGLSPSTTYYARMFARNQDGEVHEGNEIEFSTPQRLPVAAYPLDEGEGEVAGDLFGEHHGAIEGGVEWFDNGRFGSALDFDGEEESCVTVPDAEDLRITEELTVEAWVRPSSLSGQPIIYKDSYGFKGHQLAIGLYESGKPEAFLGEGYEGEFDTVEGTKSLEANVWTHLAFTYDGGKMRLYVDGELVDDKGHPEGAPWGEGDLVIGCNPNYSPERFEGLIDEVRVYNRALGAGEVAADMGAGIQTPSSSPVAAYPLDEGEGEVAGDLFGEHHGAIEGGVEWFDNGRFGSALDFDGEEESCVTVPDAEDLRITEELTVEAWVRPSSLSGQPIIYKDSYGFKGHQLAIGLYESGKPEGFLGEGYEGEFDTVEGTKSLEANVWTHLAFTYDGGKMRLYVDGELVDDKGHPEGAPWGEGDLVIGCNPNYSPERFEGLIDEVRVYNRALGAGEVAADMGTPAAV